MDDFNSEHLKLKHRIQGFSNGLSADIALTLEGALDVVTGKIYLLSQKAEQTESLIRKKRYLEKLKSEIKKVFDEVYAEIGKKVEEKSVEIGLATPALMNTVANRTLNIGFAEPHLDKKIVTSWFQSSQVEGLFFNEWLTKLSDNAVSRIIKETRESVILAEPLRETAKRIENALNVSKRSAQGLAQNAIFQMHNYAELDCYKQNRDIIGRVRFSAVLDRSTSPLCISLSEKVFDFKDAPIPPLHWRCRSSLVPVFLEKVVEKITGTKTALQQTGKRTVKHRDSTTSTAYRNLRVQTVPEKMSYSQWMQSLVNSSNPKDVSFAREVLGKSRFELVASGKLKVDSLYYHGKIRTIEQLKRLL